MRTNHKQMKKVFIIRTLLIIAAFLVLIAGAVAAVLLLNSADVSLKEDLISASNASYDIMDESAADPSSGVGKKFINYSLMSIPIILVTIIVFIILFLVEANYYKKECFKNFYKPIIGSVTHTELQIMKNSDAPTHFFGASNIFRWVPYRGIAKLYYFGQSKDFNLHYMNFREETKTEENDGGTMIAIITKKAFQERIMLSYYVSVYGKMFSHLKEQKESIKGYEKYHLYTTEKESCGRLNEATLESLNKFVDFYYKKYSEKANADILSFHISASGNIIYLYFKGAEIISPNYLRYKHLAEEEKDLDYLFDFISKIKLDLVGESDE